VVKSLDLQPCRDESAVLAGVEWSERLCAQNAMAPHWGTSLCCLAIVLAPPSALAHHLPPTDSASRVPAVTAHGPEGLIHLDVVVKTATGQPVIGLESRQFAVSDNGQPVKILSFRPYTEGEAAPSPALIVVLDTLGLSAETETLERQELTSFLREHDGHLAQPISLLLLTGTGLWRIGQLSDDGNALSADLAHNRITPWGGDAVLQHSDLNWLPSQAIDAAGTMGAMRQDLAGLRPPEAALRALAAIAAVARREPEPKVLFWIGPPFGVASGANPNEPVNNKVEQQAAFDQVVWFSTLFRLARMRLCDKVVSPPGASPRGETILPASAFHPVNSPNDLNPLDAAHGILELNRRVLTVESGGEVLEGGDMASQVEGCFRDTRAAYTLTFDPTPAQHVDDYHTLQVHLQDGGLTTHASTGYYDEPWYTDTPDPTIRPMTVAQLDSFVHTAAETPDSDLARQLRQVRLTERATKTQAAAWTALVRGKKAREALAVLVDLSDFLAPPSAGIPPDPPPDTAAQQAMLALAKQYVHQTIPRLPNFFARRIDVDYEEIPPFYREGGHYSAAEPLHIMDSSHTTVVFRSGGEVVDAKVLQRAAAKGDLSTYGTFGPVLGSVEEALTTPMIWSRWERNEDGERVAVFRYSVPATASHSETGGCCSPEGDGRIGFAVVSAYHGEITLDPATGAVLRLLIDEDLDGFVPVDRGELVVTYGPVAIGDRTWICPLESISLLRTRSITTRTEWDGIGYRTWGPYATKLNHFRFDDYHLFRARVRILPGVTREDAP